MSSSMTMIPVSRRTVQTVPTTHPGLKVINRLIPALCILSMTVLLRHADAYRFSTLESTSNQFPTVTPPRAWDPDVWGRGETLSFVLVDSPEWDASSTDIEEIKDIFEKALGAWEDVPSTDIRWEISETVSEEDLEELDESKHYLVTQTGRVSTTRTTFTRKDDGVWYASWVRIAIGDEHIADPNFFRYAILHELGHAVGLAHASVYSHGERPGNIPDGLLTTSWWFDPVMSYGHAGQDRYRDYDSMLTPDDRVGASLLRPREGWLDGTGNIRGTVLLDQGGGAGLVHVLATRLLADGRMAESVGAFTNLRGEFVIGGLRPGEYALLVRALVIRRAHPSLLPWVSTGIRDTIWGAPVTVRSGRRAGPVIIVVSSGEERAAS